jgi:hypothetical protein
MHNQDLEIGLGLTGEDVPYMAFCDDKISRVVYGLCVGKMPSRIGARQEGLHADMMLATWMSGKVEIHETILYSTKQ